MLRKEDFLFKVENILEINKIISNRIANLWDLNIDPSEQEVLLLWKYCFIEFRGFLKALKAVNKKTKVKIHLEHYSKEIHKIFKPTFNKRNSQILFVIYEQEKLKSLEFRIIIEDDLEILQLINQLKETTNV